MPVNTVAFYYMFKLGALRRGDENGVVFYAEGAHKDQYGFT